MDGCYKILDNELLIMICCPKDSFFRGRGGGSIAYLLPTQQLWVRFSTFPIIFVLMLLRFIDGTGYNIGQRNDNVNQTHLVLAGGKIELQLRLILLIPVVQR